MQTHFPRVTERLSEGLNCVQRALELNSGRSPRRESDVGGDRSMHAGGTQGSVLHV